MARYIGDKEVADFLIKEEGFLDKPTDIGDGKITLGSGLTDPKWHALYRKKGKWSKEDNRNAVLEEVAKRRIWAEDTIPNWEQLPESAQDALLSYKYNYNFTPINSPNLFEAMREGNFFKAAEEINATSKDPKFRKGLEERRKREQEMFLSDLMPQKTSNHSVYAPYTNNVVSDNTRVVRYPTREESSQFRTIVPERNYIETTTISPGEQRAQQLRNTFESNRDYNRMMQNISIQNNPQPTFTPQYNYHSDGGPLNTPKLWDDLSLTEKSDMIRVAIENGITTLPEIRKAYNEFAEGGGVDTINTYETGGNLYSGEESHSSQMNQGHVYDVLPKMLKEAGLDVRVTSGYRKAGQAGNAGNKSWHTRHGAVDIVPQGKTTFEDIENTLYNNPAIADYMLKNGFGLIDESGRSAESRATMKKTGATGAHFHIGKDSLAVKNYNNRASFLLDNKMHQLQSIIQQPIEQVAPEFTPFNPQAFSAFMGVDGNYEDYAAPQVVDVEEPLVQAAMESAYSPEQIEREERAQGLRNLGLAMSIMRGGQSSAESSSLWDTVGLLTGSQFKSGGKIYIKPENRGKFTALKKRTGHSATWFKEHGTPAQKKMATFALNSRHWNKHALGGYLEGKEYDLPQEEIKRLIDLGYEIEYL